LQTKSQKKLILTGAARFNSKPKTGLAFFEENGLIYMDLSPEISKPHSLATFLKGCTRLDKRLLGDYVSKPENIEILKAFMGLFDFKNVRKSVTTPFLFCCLTSTIQKPVADAMRELLETFRLPGEAQQISRITEVFASVYFAAGPGTTSLVSRPACLTCTLSEEIKSEDAVYVLAYSIILLNTDLHNPQITVSCLCSVLSFF
jgi:brefeldin A-resistance guanine nucleotide exchange factor 1